MTVGTLPDEVLVALDEARASILAGLGEAMATDAAIAMEPAIVEAFMMAIYRSYLEIGLGLFRKVYNESEGKANGKKAKVSLQKRVRDEIDDLKILQKVRGGERTEGMFRSGG